MNVLVIAMHVIVVGSRVSGLVQVPRGIRIVFSVIRERPELCPSSCSPHHLQHFPFIHVPCYSYLLLIQVNFEAVYACKKSDTCRLGCQFSVFCWNFCCFVNVPSILEIALLILFSHPSQSICTRSSTIYINKRKQRLIN